MYAPHAHVHVMAGRFLYTDNSVLYIRYLSILPTLEELRSRLGHTVIDVGRLELYTCAGVVILGQNVALDLHPLWINKLFRRAYTKRLKHLELYCQVHTHAEYTRQLARALYLFFLASSPPHLSLYMLSSVLLLPHAPSQLPVTSLAATLPGSNYPNMGCFHI